MKSGRKSVRRSGAQTNVDVKYLFLCLPWICVLSVDGARFRLRAYANISHYPHSGPKGKSSDARDEKASCKIIHDEQP